MAVSNTLIALTPEQCREVIADVLLKHLQPLLRELRKGMPEQAVEYLTTNQALQMLHISKPTLYKLVREGKLQNYRSSDKRVLYKRHELQHYVEVSAKPKEGRTSC